MRILIIDDDKDLLAVLKDILVRYEHAVECIDNAKDALEDVKTNEYDFILLDYKMPEKDGCWFLQNSKLPRKTKVLLITAYVDRDVIKRMFSMGASGYLIKPFDEEDLVRHLEFFSHYTPVSTTVR